MKEGKLVSANPNMANDGDQRNWHSDKFDQRYYEFILEFDNGDKGVASSKNEGTYTYSAGSELSYNIKDTSEGKYLPKISGVKKKEGGNFGGGGGGSSYNDPSNNLRMAMSTAQESAVIAFKAFMPNVKEVEDINNMSDFFYAWVSDHGKIIDRDTLSKRWYALDKAVKCIEFKEMKVDTSDKILDVAEKFLSAVMKINHEK